jgi:hypothetical protein
MVNRSGLVLIGAVAILLATVFTGASAFNSFSADRSASLDVVSDSNGVIGLSDGGSDYVTTNSDGALKIDVTNNGSNSGVNVDATLEIGDPENPSDTYAFSITNNYGQSRTVDLNYALDEGDAAGSSEQVNFTVYDSDGDSVVSVSEDDSGSFEPSSADTYYVVLTVDTNQVTNSADYSGTLTISAS